MDVKRESRSVLITGYVVGRHWVGTIGGPRANASCSVAPRVVSVSLLRRSSSGEVCRDGFRTRTGRLINAIGFKVIATARSEAVIEHLASLGYHAVQLDVTDAASIDACREIVVGLTGGRLDILMNNA
jgi:hypothetical protein